MVEAGKNYEKKKIIDKSAMRIRKNMSELVFSPPSIFIWFYSICRFNIFDWI